jgi:ferrous iron transport protein A
VSLLDVPRGKEAVIREINCGVLSKQRLGDLGIYCGGRLTVRGFAPLGDPMIVEVGDALVAVRKSEARQIEVNA